MFDAGSLDPGGELRSNLLGQLRGNLTAKEVGDLLRLYIEHRLADELVVKGPQRRGGPEHKVRGIFHLHQAPVIRLAEHIQHRTTERGITIEHTMQPVW